MKHLLVITIYCTALHYASRHRYPRAYPLTSWEHPQPPVHRSKHWLAGVKQLFGLLGQGGGISRLCVHIPDAAL